MDAHVPRLCRADPRHTPMQNRNSTADCCPGIATDPTGHAASSMSPQKPINMATCQVYNILDRSLPPTLSLAFSHVLLSDLAPWGIPHRAFRSWSNLATTIEYYSGEVVSTWRLRIAATMSPVRMSRTSMNRPSRTAYIAFPSSSQFQFFLHRASFRERFPTCRPRNLTARRSRRSTLSYRLPRTLRQQRSKHGSQRYVIWTTSRWPR